jgi:hypothetical protein
MSFTTREVTLTKDKICMEESVGERTKSTREKKGQNKSVSWGGETRAVSHEKTRAVSHEKKVS